MNVTAPLLLLLLTACVVSEAKLSKAMWHFAQLITCYQPGINPLIYNEYGCFCGFGGSGTPVDGVDRCCEAHDNCYHVSKNAPGCTSVSDLPYIIDYDFTCSNKKVTCSASNDKCQAAVCECDRVAASCFASNRYNSENKNLDSSACS